MKHYKQHILSTRTGNGRTVETRSSSAGFPFSGGSMDLKHSNSRPTSTTKYVVPISEISQRSSIAGFIITQLHEHFRVWQDEAEGGEFKLHYLKGTWIFETSSYAMYEKFLRIEKQYLYYITMVKDNTKFCYADYNTAA